MGLSGVEPATSALPLSYNHHWLSPDDFGLLICCCFNYCLSFLYRIPYDPNTIPVVLCRYLDSARKCLCGTACFEAFLHYIATLDLHKVSATVTAVDQAGTTRIPIELFLCSARCLKLWRM